MKKVPTVLAIIGLLGFGTCLLAGELPPPPARSDRPVSDELYFRKIHQEWNNLVITTTNPNGNIRGIQGDILVYNNGGSYKFCVLVTAPTTWRCSANALTAP